MQKATPSKNPSPLASIEWIAQRLSACLLIPCSLWILFQADFTQKSAFLAWATLPSSKLILSLFQSACALHVALGIKVVLEDYIHQFFLKRTLIRGIFLISFFCLCGGLWCVWII